MIIDLPSVKFVIPVLTIAEPSANKDEISCFETLKRFFSNWVATTLRCFTQLIAMKLEQVVMRPINALIPNLFQTSPHDDVPKRQANVSATPVPIKTEPPTINAASRVGTASNETIARPPTM